MAWSQHNKKFLPIDDEADSTTGSDTDSLFEKSDDDTDNTEILSDECGNDSDNESCLSEDEEQRPPEYYLAESENLDVQRLRQRRYSPKTQDRLDWVKEHWEQ